MASGQKPASPVVSSGVIASSLPPAFHLSHSRYGTIPDISIASVSSPDDLVAANTARYALLSRAGIARPTSGFARRNSYYRSTRTPYRRRYYRRY